MLMAAKRVRRKKRMVIISLVIVICGLWRDVLCLEVVRCGFVDVFVDVVVNVVFISVVFC